MLPDLFQLIPQTLKTQALDTIVDVVTDQAKKLISDEFSDKIKKLRSDADFREAFEQGTQRALKRFVEAYQLEDEDLVAAIARESSFFENKDVQKALLAILKKPGIALDEERDAFMQSFKTILPARINRKRVDLAVTYLLKCMAEELWNLPELAPIYSLQFQRITAESAREQITLQKAQLQTISTLNSGMRDALLQLTDAISEQKLLSVGEGDTTAKPKVLHNLPQPDYGVFVGREEELKRIHDLLRPYPHSRHFLIVVDGIGGIGKSALALEVTHHYLRNDAELPLAEQFDAIIWTSAKSDVLTADGIAPRRQVMRTLDDIYTAIAIALEREDITRASSEEQDEVVIQALTQQRTLLIVDNLETVDDENVLAFLRELPDPTKAIVTTRHRIDIAYPIRLVGMPWTDAQKLIVQESNRKQVTMTPAEQQRLYDRTGGIPLALVWSVAQMGFGYGVDSILAKLGQPTSDVTRFCFETAVSTIKPTPAYQLLLALSLFATDASRDALGFVTDLPLLDRDEGLVQLEKLSLVNKVGDRFRLLPLTHGYCQALLKEHPQIEEKFRTRWHLFFIEFLQTQRKKKDRGLDTVRPDMANIQSVMDWCWQENRITDFKNVLDLHETYFFLVGNSNALLKYYQLGIRASILLEDELAQAGLMGTLANLYEMQDKLDDAQTLLESAIAIFQRYEHKTGLIWNKYNLSTINWKRGENETAYSIALEALQIALKIENNLHIVRCRCQLARIDMHTENFEQARQHLDAALKINIKLESDGRDSWVSSTLYRLLGELEFYVQNFTQAEQYYLQSLEIARSTNLMPMESRVRALIAHLRFEQSNFEKAKQEALKAHILFKQFGMQREIKEIQQLLENVEAKL